MYAAKIDVLYTQIDVPFAININTSTAMKILNVFFIHFKGAYPNGENNYTFSALATSAFPLMSKTQYMLQKYSLVLTSEDFAANEWKRLIPDLQAQIILF